MFKRKSSEVTRPSLVAIREFNGITSKELHHAIKWDRLEILDDSDVNWYEVINLRNSQTGLIPAEYCGAEGSLEVEDWYYDDVTQENAIDLLMGPDEAEGSFLVRPAISHACKFVLSVRYERVFHYKVKETPKGLQISQVSRQFFKTLNDLINYYSAKNESSVYLRKPCQKPLPIINQTVLAAKWVICQKQYEISKNENVSLHSFFNIYQGQWNNRKIMIKTLHDDYKDNDEIKNLLRSGNFLNNLNHPNLIRIFGVTVNNRICILMEHLAYGSLNEFLMRSEGKRLLVMERVFIATQIAKAMKYLETKEITHLNLTSQNCFVGTNLLTKIGDLISQQKLYSLKINCGNSADLPCAPEGMNFMELSSKYDVWSYGTVLKEIFFNCTHENIKTTISLCRSQDPLQRPTFEYLVQFFQNFDVNNQVCLERSPSGDSEQIVIRTSNDYVEV